MKLKVILLSVVVGLLWILFASYKKKYEDKYLSKKADFKQSKLDIKDSYLNGYLTTVMHYELHGEGRHVIGIHNPERIDSIVIILDVVCKQVFKTSVNQINN